MTVGGHPVDLAQLTHHYRKVDNATW